MKYAIKIPTAKNILHFNAYLKSLNISKDFHALKEEWKKHGENTCAIIDNNAKVKFINCNSDEAKFYIVVTMHELNLIQKQVIVEEENKAKEIIKFYWQLVDWYGVFAYKNEFNREDEQVMQKFIDFMICRISESGYIAIDGNKFIKRESLENLPNTITKHD